MVNNLINEKHETSYRVILNGSVLTERKTYELAAEFVETLSEDQKGSVKIVPVDSSSGSQILLG